MPPEPIQKLDRDGDTLPVTDITKTIWQPDEESVPDMIFKENATLARLSIPSQNQSVDL